MSIERCPRFGLALGAAAMLWACSAGDPQAAGGRMTSATPAEPAPEAGPAGCPLAGSVQTCACAEGGSGHRICLSDGWGACSCAAAVDGAPAGAAGAGDATPPSGAAGASAPMASEPAFEPEPPTGVVFDWPETDPNDVVECEPGHYVGMFSCDLRIVTADGEPAFELSGTVDMQLEETADGELLRIANGTFVSAAAVAIPAWADVVGELDCSTGRFEGRLENGRFSVALGLPIPFTEGTFEGDLAADYDPDATALANGEWNMIGQLDLFPGSCMDGTWSAMRVP